MPSVHNGEYLDGTSAGLGDSGDQPRERCWLGPEVRLDGAVARALTRRAGDPCLNPGPDENV